MNPNNTRVIVFCAKMEQKLDQHLFQDPEEKRKSVIGTVAKTAAVTGGALYGGSALKRGLAPTIADRRAGMRAMIPGFTQKSGLAQTAAATGTVLRDKPLAALRSVGNTVARDARKVGRSAGMVAGQIPGAIGDTFKGAGQIAGRIASPVLARLRGLAGKFVSKAG